MPSNTVNKERMLLIAMLLSMVIWGMSWSSAKVLSSYGSPLSLVYLRFWLVVFTLLPILALLKVNLKPSRRSIPYIIGTALFMACYSTLFFTGVREGLAGAGGVLVTTINPVFAYAVGLLVSKRIPTKQESVGLLVGILGGLILIQVWQQASDILQSGNLFFVLAALSWAVMSKVNSIGARYTNAFSFVFWVNLLSTIGLSFLVDFTEVKHLIVDTDIRFIGNILYMGIINSGGATVCFLYATTQIGAERASSFNYMVPACALIGSVIFLGEPVLWHTLVGGCIAIVAVVILNRKKRVVKS